MTMSKRLRLAISLAPLLIILAFGFPARAAPPSGGVEHHSGGGARGDFHRDGRRGRFDRGGFGFGFGVWDPWWGWGPVDYWGYYDPYYYPPYYPYYYPPYPAYYGAPPAPSPQGQQSTQFTGAPPQQYWYYCDNPQGYYPYVQNCSTAWRPVAATPPSASGNTVTPNPKQ